jgi:hypothetical protein
MINTSLVLMATLASPQPTTVTRSIPKFEPNRAVVTVHDDALEIHAFDDDELIGVLLMTVDADRLLEIEFDGALRSTAGHDQL